MDCSIHTCMDINPLLIYEFEEPSNFNFNVSNKNITETILEFTFNSIIYSNIEDLEDAIDTFFDTTSNNIENSYTIKYKVIKKININSKMITLEDFKTFQLLIE